MNTKGDYYAANKLCTHLKDQFAENCEIIFIVINIDQSSIPDEHQADIRIILPKDKINSLTDNPIAQLTNDQKSPDIIIRCAKFNCLSSVKYKSLFTQLSDQELPPIILNVTEYNSLDGNSKFGIGTTLRSGIGPGLLGIDISPQTSDQSYQWLYSQLPEPLKNLIHCDMPCAIILGYVSKSSPSINFVGISEYVDICLRLHARKFDRFIFLMPLDAINLDELKPIIEKYGYQLGRFIIQINGHRVDIQNNDVTAHNNPKIIEFIDPFPLFHNEMSLLQLMTHKVTKIRLCTGDHSAVEGNCALLFYQLLDHKKGFLANGLMDHASNVIGKSYLATFYNYLFNGDFYSAEFFEKILILPEIYEEAELIWQNVCQHYNLYDHLKIIINLLIIARNIKLGAQKLSNEIIDYFMQHMKNSILIGFLNGYCEYLYDISREYFKNDPLLMNILVDYNIESTVVKLLPIFNKKVRNVIVDNMNSIICNQYMMLSKSIIFRMPPTDDPKIITRKFIQYLYTLKIDLRTTYVFSNTYNIDSFECLIQTVDLLDKNVRTKLAIACADKIQNGFELATLISHVPYLDRFNLAIQLKHKIVNDEQIIEDKLTQDFIKINDYVVQLKNILSLLPIQDKANYLEACLYFLEERYVSNLIMLLPVMARYSFLKKHPDKIDLYFDGLDTDDAQIIPLEYLPLEHSYQFILDNVELVINNDDRAVRYHILKYVPESYRMDFIKKYYESLNREKRFDVFNCLFSYIPLNQNLSFAVQHQAEIIQLNSQSIIIILDQMKPDDLNKFIEASNINDATILQYIQAKIVFAKHKVINNFSDFILLCDSFKLGHDKLIFIKKNLKYVNDKSNIRQILNYIFKFNDYLYGYQFNHDRYIIARELVSGITSVDEALALFSWISTIDYFKFLNLIKPKLFNIYPNGMPEEAIVEFRKVIDKNNVVIDDFEQYFPSVQLSSRIANSR